MSKLFWSIEFIAVMATISKTRPAVAMEIGLMEAKLNRRMAAVAEGRGEVA
jgi:hypothetical protein